jgi:acetyl esterase/lipase
MSRVPSALTDLLADAELAAFVEASRSPSQQSARELGPAAMRAAQRTRIASRPPGPVMADVRDLTVQGGAPVRLYRPATGPHPLLVFLHGGFGRSAIWSRMTGPAAGSPWEQPYACSPWITGGHPKIHGQRP